MGENLENLLFVNGEISVDEAYGEEIYRYCPSRKLDKLTGRLSSDLLQADSIRASGYGTA